MTNRFATFRYWDTDLEYHDHPYNTTRLNERTVEIPIAHRFVEEATSNGPTNGLEVGNVLAHYHPAWHRVVDRYEPGAENIDVFDIDGTYDWIVAISTLEHVRWDEHPKHPDGAGQALRHLQQLLNPTGRMLITVPFGWHPFLDSEIIDGAFTTRRDSTMIRWQGTNEWAQVAGAEHHRYAATTIWADAVWIAELEALSD